MCFCLCQLWKKDPKPYLQTARCRQASRRRTSTRWSSTASTASRPSPSCPSGAPRGGNRPRSCGRSAKQETANEESLSPDFLEMPHGPKHSNLRLRICLSPSEIQASLVRSIRKPGHRLRWNQTCTDEHPAPTSKYPWQDPYVFVCLKCRCTYPSVRAFSRRVLSRHVLVPGKRPRLYGQSATPLVCFRMSGNVAAPSQEHSTVPSSESANKDSLTPNFWATPYEPGNSTPQNPGIRLSQALLNPDSYFVD